MSRERTTSDDQGRTYDIRDDGKLEERSESPTDIIIDAIVGWPGRALGLDD